MATAFFEFFGSGKMAAGYNGHGVFRILLLRKNGPGLKWPRRFSDSSAAEKRPRVKMATAFFGFFCGEKTAPG